MRSLLHIRQCIIPLSLVYHHLSFLVLVPYRQSWRSTNTLGLWHQTKTTWKILHSTTKTTQQKLTSGDTTVTTFYFRFPYNIFPCCLTNPCGLEDDNDNNWTIFHVDTIIFSSRNGPKFQISNFSKSIIRTWLVYQYHYPTYDTLINYSKFIFYVNVCTIIQFRQLSINVQNWLPVPIRSGTLSTYFW